MSRLKFWDALQAIGAVASIIGVVFSLGAGPGLRTALALLVAIGVAAVIIASVMSRRGLQSVGREAMIQTGRRLIRDVKTEAVMFSGDMSWASDYEEAIRSATSSGKRVRVLYPQSDAAKVQRNAQILKDAGAELLPTLVDSGMRALLVDPADSKDALLYVATRTLRRGAVPVQVGDHGSEGTYEYIAKIYTMDREWVIIQAARKICDVLVTSTRQAGR